ncbi:hypothetical protein Gogos_017474, partial [Gossypium gossypioides]|nr:hypothetical protein [Gossypium gossypioides]
MAEGLGVHDPSLLSNMIRDVDSDSMFRLNRYPPSSFHTPPPPHRATTTTEIGFGEHTDPQMLTILRSNDVGGLQICVAGGTWVPVTPDPTAFCINVGDVLQ